MAIIAIESDAKIKKRRKIQRLLRTYKVSLVVNKEKKKADHQERNIGLETERARSLAVA